MPFVNVKILDDNVTREQKSELIARITDALVDVLAKSPEKCHIVIEEVNLDNWGLSGRSVRENRELAAGQ